MQLRQGFRPRAAGFGHAPVGGVGLGQSAGPIDHEPDVQRVVLPLGTGQMGLGQGA